LDALCTEFGASILTSDGTLNRKKLAEIVFGDPNALQRLNELSHRFVMEEIRNQLKKLRNQDRLAAVIDAPQLFEAGADRDCNLVISVLADKRLRLERIIERDGIDAESAMRRIDAQRSDEFFRTHSNYIIENNGSIDHLRPEVKRILAEMGVVAP
jgi:dephospho-CoA kinase